MDLRDHLSLLGKVKGTVQIEFEDPTTGEREIVLEESSNAIGTGLVTLFATFIVNPSLASITHMAVGVGPVPSGYNVLSPPSVVGFETLAGELARVRLEGRNFLDALDEPTTAVTSTPSLTAAFGENEAVGTLREVGLFGGPEAATANSGILTNYKAFSPISKPSGKKMFITWRILFTL